MRRRLIASLGFSRATRWAQDTTQTAVLYGNNVPFSGWTNSRESVPKLEKKTLAWSSCGVTEFECVTAQLAQSTRISTSALGNINPIPFWHPREKQASPSRWYTALACTLGSTDPHSTTVHVEPFSTSVSRFRTWIFATTTEICTAGSSSWDHSQSLRRNRHDPPTPWDQATSAQVIKGRV